MGSQTRPQSPHRERFNNVDTRTVRDMIKEETGRSLMRRGIGTFCLAVIDYVLLGKGAAPSLPPNIGRDGWVVARATYNSIQRFLDSQPGRVAPESYDRLGQLPPLS